ncbi:unnamed protein product [Laminaria digitata]
MLYGGDSRAVLDLISYHVEKKCMRNLLTALQELENEGGKRKGGRGQQPGKASQGLSQSRQVFVYSTSDEVMDMITLPPSAGAGLLTGTQQGFGPAGGKAGRGLR